MVNGREEIKCKCAVVDLDGTLLRGNSLRMLILFLLSRMCRRGQFAGAASVVMSLLCRKCRLISHVRMKYPVHRLAFSCLSTDDVEDFAILLRSKVNEPLFGRLSSLQASGFKVIVATAAPSIYMDAFVGMLGLDSYVATELADDVRSYVESRGERKAALVKAFADREGLDIALVATDHEDDMPLLRFSGIERLLVNPTHALRCQLMKEGLCFKEMREDGLIRSPLSQDRSKAWV